MSSARRQRPAVGGLSYHDASYWQDRFSSDPREASGFEWLSSSTSLLSLLPASLLLRAPPARILHIGVGTSRLSLDLLAYYCESAPDDWRERAKQVVNVDFSEKSIEFQRQAELALLKEVGEDTGGEVLMEYYVLDLLNYQRVESVLGEKERKFDVVLDKSTTDSISTGEDTPFELIQEGRHHESLVRLAQSSGIAAKGLATTQILGVSLASVVGRDGIWLCHSYSSGRWDDVLLQSESEDRTGTEAWPWRETSKTAVPVESSHSNAPQINHWIYTLQRI